MLQDELLMVMRLSGAPNVESLTLELGITKNFGDHIVPQPMDYLVQKTYMKLWIMRLFAQLAFLFFSMSTKVENVIIIIINSVASWRARFFAIFISWRLHLQNLRTLTEIWQ